MELYQTNYSGEIFVWTSQSADETNHSKCKFHLFPLRVNNSKFRFNNLIY